jgi:DNA-binding IscR family transcriptional regulator
MVDADILGSRRGVSGGYWLSRPLVEVSVLEVVAALQNRDAEGVSDGDAPALVRRVENLIARQLAAVSVWDVTGESERG